MTKQEMLFLQQLVKGGIIHAINKTYPGIRRSYYSHLYVWKYTYICSDGFIRSTDLLMASVIATVIVPVLLYAFTLVTRLLNNHNTDSDGRSFGSSDTPSDK